jgi:ATP-binding cassette, subfamily C, bacterial
VSTADLSPQADAAPNGAGRRRGGRTGRGTEPNLIAVALHACRAHIWALIGFSFLYNLLFLAPALFMMQLYDRVLATRGLETLVFLCLVLIAALTTLGVMDWVRSRLLTRIGVRLDELVAPRLIGSLLAGHGWVGAEQARRTQALREFDTLRQGVAGPGAIALVDLPWAVIFILVLTAIHWTIGLIALIAGLLLLGLSILNERLVKAPITRAGEAALASYALIEGSAAVAETVRGLGLGAALTAKHMAERDAATALQADASFASAFFQSAIKVLRLVAQNAILAWGAFLAVEGWITPGAMFAASILGARALQPIEQLTAGWGQLVKARNAYTQLKPLVSAPPLAEATALPRPEGRMSVDGLTIYRPTGGEPILRGVSLSVGPGEALGVVGKSGSGKSTLARALIGGLAPHAGQVRIDGALLTQWDADALGAHLGYLPQGVNLLAGTIRDNISRFAVRLGAAEAEVSAAAVAAAKLAGAHDMILGLPKGYDTILTVHGGGLSGGQAQRIGLARALYGDPALLILDEPNAFLDQEGEIALLKAIDAVRARRGAVIMVAHRAGVLNICDRIAVLNGGRIELQGPRDQVYAKLAELGKAGGGVVAGGGRA